MKKLLIIPFIAIMLCGCEIEYNNDEDNNNNQSVHYGKCLEYATEYQLDCGFFVDSDSFCKERKYDKCIRWEEIDDEQ